MVTLRRSRAPRALRTALLRDSKRDWEAIVLERVWISLSGVNASEELRFKPPIREP